MRDASTLDGWVELVRARLGAGAGHDEVLGELRRDGLEKSDCVAVIGRAAGVPMDDAKLLVHRSPVWADRRESDEYLEEQFWRGLFILCVVGDGQVNEPEQLAAECQERQRRATAQMQHVAATLSPDAAIDYHRCLDAGRFGAAFAALVAAGRHETVPRGYWQALATVAETLCLTELVDEQQPPADGPDYVHAAHVVRRLASAAPD